jgi:amidohydrolase
MQALLSPSAIPRTIPAMRPAIDSILAATTPRAIEIRRQLHTWPELGYEEVRTAQTIREELARLGIERVYANIDNAPTATVAVLGDPAKRCVSLRADIDALPILENTGTSYVSKRPGVMHACGHDGHTANLLNTAAVLKQIERELPVCVKLIFQPAEEGGAGGERLVKAGVLDGRVGPKVSAIYGLHGWPGLPCGVVSTKPGPLLAATDCFHVTFRGVGCHGAFPHLGKDPIVAASEAVSSLQHVVSREVDPTEPALITVGKFHAGTATNVIPDEAVIEGTIRTLTPAVRKQARAALQRRCEGVALAHGISVKIEFRDGYPPTTNDPKEADFVAQVAREVLGAERFIPAARPVMGGEDFAYYLEQVPGAFFMVGVIPAGKSEHPPLHSDRFDFTDDAMPTCTRMFVELVLRQAV